MRQWLRDLRGNKRQADIAKKLGITQQYYSYIENGIRKNKLDIGICGKLAEVFGITIADVIAYETGRK